MDAKGHRQSQIGSMPYLPGMQQHPWTFAAAPVSNVAPTFGLPPALVFSRTPERSASPKLLVVLGLLTLILLAAGRVSAADDAWLDDDSFWENVATPERNKGELKFLSRHPTEPVHHHVNRITVDADSLTTGWVELNQCHQDIDRVSRAQILYRSDATEDLEILHEKNIGESWVQGASVQLRQVGEGAELCIRARSRMLTAVSDGQYVLNNGPFMRRFFDGYFPMRVTVEVSWEGLDLAFESSDPPAQEGFAVAVLSDSVTVEATFEGRLRTALFLKNGQQPNL